MPGAPKSPGSPSCPSLPVTPFCPSGPLLPGAPWGPSLPVINRDDVVLKIQPNTTIIITDKKYFSYD